MTRGVKRQPAAVPDVELQGPIRMLLLSIDKMHRALQASDVKQFGHQLPHVIKRAAHLRRLMQLQ